MFRILVVRLGAMGDVIHALPAAASLKQSFRGAQLTWVVDPKWAPLLVDNPFIDQVVPFNRRSLDSVREARRRLREARFDLAVDFQGLLKSALVALLARPEKLIGFHSSEARERLAALFYSSAARTGGGHVVDRNLELAQAAGATSVLRTFPLPPGESEGAELPSSGFVLANPQAGWPAKQWPLERYGELGQRLRRECGLELVLNGAAAFDIPNTRSHVGGLAGLIHATRRAAAVVGLDSGPLHLAAALGKPGVALFGPTDPERNGPYGSTFTVLRDPRAVTSYKRRGVIDPSMFAISVDQVMDALKARIGQPAAAGAARHS